MVVTTRDISRRVACGVFRTLCALSMCGAALAAPHVATAAEKTPPPRFHYVTEISRDALTRTYGGSFSAWRETVELRLRSSGPAVRVLRRQAPDTEQFDAALKKILGRTGLFPDYDYYWTERRDLRRPRVAVSRHVLDLRVDVGRHWNMDQSEKAFCLHLNRPDADDAVLPGVVELRLRGYDVESVRPFPMSDDGSGDIKWHVRRHWPKAFDACVVRASENFVTGVRTRAGWFRLFYPPVDYMPLLLVFLLGAWALRRARKQGLTAAADLGSVLRAALWLSLVLVAAWWARVLPEFVFDHADRLGRNAQGWWDAADRLFEVANVVGVMALGIGVLVVVSLTARVAGWGMGRVRFAAVVVLALVTAAALAAADVTSDKPLVLDNVREDYSAYHAGMAAASAAFVIAAAATLFGCAAVVCVTLAARSSSWVNATLLPRRRLISGAALTLGLFIGGHWLWGIQHETSVERGGLTERLLTSGFVYSGLSLVTASLFALPIAMFLALLALMRASRSPGRSFGQNSNWLRLAVPLVFAAYVVGRGGFVDRLNVPLPVAFVFAFPALLVLALRVRDSASDGRLLGRGPGVGWWENGVRAARLALPLAAVPFGFYVYILLNARLGRAFALDSTEDFPYLLTWIANEAIFWVAAALCLGWLLAYLPGRNAVLKGLALAAVYAGSVGIGALLVGPADEHWLFRAFVLVLFYIGVGIRLDLEAVWWEWRELVSGYRLTTVRGVTAYAAPALIALIGIVQQIYSGDPQQAGHDLLSGLTTFIPKIGDSGG